MRSLREIKKKQTEQISLGSFLLVVERRGNSFIDIVIFTRLIGWMSKPMLLFISGSRCVFICIFLSFQQKKYQTQARQSNRPTEKREKNNKMRKSPKLKFSKVICTVITLHRMQIANDRCWYGKLACLCKYLNRALSVVHAFVCEQFFFLLLVSYSPVNMNFLFETIHTNWPLRSLILPLLSLCVDGVGFWYWVSAMLFYLVNSLYAKFYFLRFPNENEQTTWNCAYNSSERKWKSHMPA